MPLASLTYPLKITKGQPTPHPIMSCDILLVGIRLNVGLSGGCGWCLKLKHLKLPLKGGDCHCPLLELEVLLLVGVLEVYNRIGAGVHLLVGEV
jgi:hypothetical protein